MRYMADVESGELDCAGFLSSIESAIRLLVQNKDTGHWRYLDHPLLCKQYYKNKENNVNLDVYKIDM